MKNKQALGFLNIYIYNMFINIYIYICKTSTLQGGTGPRMCVSAWGFLVYTFLSEWVCLHVFMCVHVYMYVFACFFMPF